MNLLAVVCSAIQDKVNITCEVFFFFFGLNCNQTLKAKGVKGLRNAESQGVDSKSDKGFAS